MRANIIKYFAPADYRENSQLDALVKSIIDKTVIYETLEKYYEENKRGMEDYLTIDPHRLWFIEIIY
ncbi:MAG: hypothetical protein LKF87_13075 [Clostridium tyrobutyricum]|jgi:hypothetical protein|nr:hypothetical protein [Clostridium tyrobutyricum]MBV4437236.1 hypothetical protein [Clostridium tyrobutyricum]MCH4237835.1 hypothetical protein [Clostridium tyrobutyricum]MCH4259851.1 hypothetical protein [Clostridium tyrobutyricum]MCI1240261.1 hypothetical protein [Clostridium tyrobutyricum]MCI1651654.1 hypothetical protein [Clostridium tyrobutyricum]